MPVAGVEPARVISPLDFEVMWKMADAGADFGQIKNEAGTRPGRGVEGDTI